MKTFSYSLLLILAFGLFVNAQTSIQHYERITSDNGLSQNLIWTIFQDRKGFLWFGTKDGLNKYDGYMFSYYRYDPNDSTSISPGHVHMIHECASGFLWIAIGGETINIMNERDERIQRLRLPKDDVQKAIFFRVTGIVEETPEEHWVRMENGALFNIKHSLHSTQGIENNPEDFTITSYDSINDVNVHVAQNASISSDGTGRIWLNTDEGLVLLKNHTATVFPEITLPDSTPSFIQNINWAEYHAPDSTLWIANKGILFHIKKNVDTPEQYPIAIKPDTAVTENKGQKIGPGYSSESEESFWTSSGENIVKINPREHGVEQFLSIPDELTNVAKRVFSMLQDRGGILWLGTPGAGVLKYNPIFSRFNTPKEKYWGKFYQYSLEMFLESRKTHPSPLEKFTINYNEHRYIRDHTGKYWIIDYNIDESKETRILVYDSVKNTVKKYDTRTPPFKNYWFSMRGIAEDNSGMIWLATFDILSRFDPVRETVEHFYPANGMIKPATLSKEVQPDNLGIGSTFFKDRDGNFWWNSRNNGLFFFNPLTLQLRIYKNIPGDLHSLSHNEIISINENPRDTDNLLWIGTEGGGLNILNKSSGIFTRYTTHDGLPNNVINGILFDKEGNGWLSTNFGICKFNRTTGVLKTFDINDGLQGNEFDRFKYFQSSDGMMFFGGKNGINAFYPELVKDNNHIPQLSLTDLRLQNRSISVSDPHSPLNAVIEETKQLTLPYSENMITLEFAALDFSNSLKNLYSYKLDGFNKDWSYPRPQRTATYTNLDPGEYVFHVRGCNNDGAWNLEGASLTIIILPPWYMTWWFYTLSFITIVGTITTIVQSRFKRLRREQEVRKQFSLELLASQEAERKRISGELHDSVGQNILLIKNRAHFGLQVVSDVASAQEQLNEIASLAGDSLNQVREISHNLRPLHLDRLGLTQAIHMLLDQIERNSSIAIQHDIASIDGLVPKEHEVNIFRIVQECLNNVLKHSKARHVSVSAQINNSNIGITIKDDGVGFDFDQKQRLTKNYGMGLSGLLERARIIDGKLTISSSPGKGTITNLEIPFSKPQAPIL